MPIFARVALLALCVLLAGCTSGDPDIGADVPDVEDADAVHGTILFATSGDPVSGAIITPLVGSPVAAGDFSVFAVDPNTPATTTDSDGRFTLAYDGALPEVGGIEVTIAVPSASGEFVGRLDWRGAFEPGQVLEITEPRDCGDATDCGDLLYPDLMPIVSWSDVSAETEARLRPGTDSAPSAGLFPVETWFVDESDGSRLLRFATVAVNVGDGPLDVIAEAVATGDTASTGQRIWTDEWNFTDVESGDFLHHPTHDHIHFDAFERYRLLDVDGGVVASSEKVSFCLRDSVRIFETDGQRESGSMLVGDEDCGALQQVINPGFGDHYHALLDDQWIDITGVPDGTYVLEITVDPLDLIVEADESNNVASFELTLSG